MMFARLLWKLLRGSSGRLTVAMIGVISGAAVISALLNLELDIGRKLSQEFRSLGANIVIAPKPSAQTGAGAALLLSENPIASGELARGLAAVNSPDVAASAPYLYVVAHVANVPVVVAGTWLDQTPKLDPTWKLDGNWVASREDNSHCLVGGNVARQFHLAPGSQLDLAYLAETASCNVAGIFDSGAAEDNQVFVNLPVAQHLAGIQGAISLWQLSVGGGSRGIAAYAQRLATQFPNLDVPNFDVRPIPQVTQAEGDLMGRIRLLIVATIVLILVLTTLCVLATMAALAMERRADVGLMKALGGSISRVLRLFLAEVGVLGAVGGVLGCAVGLLLSRWMGQRVFSAAISPRWEVFPLTIFLMIGVALAGALPLRLLGKVKPAVILRGE
ncbi:MAG TPA: ABC transporter permease [Candidatus Acidoferrales bacterium]|nr:ABC transporter permease [Candidatus Acidoferrales bacterium]